MSLLHTNESVVTPLYQVGMVTIIAIGTVVRVNGSPIRLTKQETDFLFFLFAGKGTVRTKKMFFAELYAHGRNIDIKIFDVLACKIRLKLEQATPKAGRALKTIWGRGYAWGEPYKTAVPITKIELPTDQRWTPSRKSLVIEAVLKSKVAVAEVLDAYPNLSPEELLEWRDGYHMGHRGLRTTYIRAQTPFRLAA